MFRTNKYGAPNLDLADMALIFAALVGGLGGLVFGIINSMDRWVYESSGAFFFIAVAFLLFRHQILKGK